MNVDVPTIAGSPSLLKSPMAPGQDPEPEKPSSTTANGPVVHVEILVKEQVPITRGILERVGHKHLTCCWPPVPVPAQDPSRWTGCDPGSRSPAAVRALTTMPLHACAPPVYCAVGDRGDAGGHRQRPQEPAYLEGRQYHRITSRIDSGRVTDGVDVQGTA